MLGFPKLISAALSPLLVFRLPGMGFIGLGLRRRRANQRTTSKSRCVPFSLLNCSGKRHFGRLVLTIFALAVCTTVWADDPSAGILGINSRGLGLTGAGVNIGQIELGRPGERLSTPADALGEWFWDYGPDGIRGNNDVGENDGVYQNGESWVDLNGSGTYTAGWVNAHPDVEPWRTRVVGAAPSRSPVLRSVIPNGFFIYTLANYNSGAYTNADNSIDRHALQVAGVMISNGAADKGVSTGARLYSGAFGLAGSTDDDTIITGQDIIRQVFDPQDNRYSDIRSVNHSWGSGPGPTDGSSQITRSIDYLASKYDVLQVIAGDERRLDSTGNDVSRPENPSDLYNGINVSMLRTDPSTGIFDRYDGINRYFAPANGRIAVQLVAPGRDINMPLLGGTTYATNLGTSFAAPHVTATSALLQEFGNAQRAANAPRWDGSARVHQVMKAVLMNSADKIKDDGFYVPIGNALGMEKTIYRDSTGTRTWLDNVDGQYQQFKAVPLDSHIGTGALNANRALIQYRNGEYDAGGQIPVIGWDDGFTFAGSGQDYDYTFQVPLMGNSFVSMTLAWDRVVDLNMPDGTPRADGIFQRGDNFATAGSGLLANLDLYLLKQGPDGLYNNIVANSLSSVDSVEHIFWKLDTTGNYMLRVRQLGGPVGTEYGLAWWAVAVPEPGCTLLTIFGITLVALRRHRFARAA